jgi:hypothetical protein
MKHLANRLNVETMNMKIKLLGLLLIGFLTKGFSQEYLREDIIKLTEVSTDSKYGYTQKRPIKVGSIEKEYHYLNAIRGPNGEKVTWQRNGSCCEFKSKTAAFGSGFLDVYQIQYDGGQLITLYINGYDYDNLKCPMGFTFVTQNEIKPVKVLSDSLIAKTTICSKESIYSVDDFLLKEAVGSNYSNPDKNPIFNGGIEKLKEYFIKNPVTDKRAQNNIFRVSIGFMVNCNGQTGDFQIVTKGKGDLRELANQVLEIVNKMPGDWISAEKNGQKVDCYQILNFTVIQGSLEKVTYR